MRLLDRYLLRELLTPLFFCLSGILMLCLVVDVMTNYEVFQDRKLGGVDIVTWQVITLPSYFVVVFPVTLLLALLYALTAHARNHEITAMRAAGVSVWRLALPYFITGFLGSLAVLGLNEFWIPDIETKTEAVGQRRLSAREAATNQLVRDFGFTCSPDGTTRTWLVGVYDPATGNMTRVQLDWARPDGTRRWLVADAARFTNAAWAFFNVVEFRENPSQKVDLAPALRTNVLVLPELKETPDEIRSAVKISQRLKSRKLRGVDLPVTDLLAYLRLHTQPTRAERDWLYTKLHGRLAEPWKCLVVVLIALPFGAASGRRNPFVGVAGSIAICFAYLMFQQLSLAFGAGGLLPPWLAGWLPNLTFAGIGIWLIARVR